MDVRKHYDNLYKSGVWTEENLDPRKHSKLGLILKKFKPHTRDLLLDLGCGNGRYCKIFSNRGCSVVGLDISKLALNLAKKQSAQYDLILGTAEKLPFKDGVFDKVFAMDLIEHVQNDSGCLNEIIRITKDEGIIFISFPKEKKIFKFHEDSRLGHIHTYQKNHVKEFLTRNNLTSDFYYVDAFFNYICYYLDMIGKRILTRGKFDPLKSTIKDNHLLVRSGRKILRFIASMDLIFCGFPLGNTFFVFARKKTIS